MEKQALAKIRVRGAASLRSRASADLERTFVYGKLHHADPKAGAAKHINLLLDPVREHFEKNEKVRELKAQVESFNVTR
ncbi:MAG: hypothetical protein HY556_04210 [Euryarchaeota archaeon]|nr:hypothetical protein [Euryarchaeota archaeon]